MLPLKLISQYLFIAKCPHRVDSHSDFLITEKYNFYRFAIGTIMAISWIIICESYIIFRALNYSETAMTKWLCAYLLCFLCELIIVDFLKIIIKFSLNNLWLKMAFSNFASTRFGAMLTKLVDAFYYYLT